jgi:cation:H+ antiporter
MLPTLAMFATGIAIVIFTHPGRRGTQMRGDVGILGRDLGFFIVGYGIAIGTAFLPAPLGWLKWVAAVVLLVVYAIYVRAHFTDEAAATDPEELNTLHLSRLPGAGPDEPPPARAPIEIDAFAGDHSITGREPTMRLIVIQILLALGLIILGAQVFVGAVQHISTVIGLDPTILALIIAPIATELPEKFNSVLWVRNGKDTLAMGNITGAMVFQSCIPAVLGLLFTEWTFTPERLIVFASAGVAFVSTILIFGNMVRSGRLSAWYLLIGGPLYLLYVFLALFTPLGIGAGAIH